MKRPQGLRGRGFSELVICRASRRSWLAVASSRRRSGAPTRSIRSASSSPKTVRRMISRVIACIEGAAANGGAVRPGGDLALGDRAHRLAVGLHPLAVEGRQHQPALAHVLGAVEQQHRAVAEQRPQDVVVLAGVASASGSPVKTVFTASGSEVMTIVRSSERRRVKYSP